MNPWPFYWVAKLFMPKGSWRRTVSPTPLAAAFCPTVFRGGSTVARAFRQSNAFPISPK